MFWIFIYIIHYCDVNVYFIYLHIKNVPLKLCIRFHISIYLFTTYILWSPNISFEARRFFDQLYIHQQDWRILPLIWIQTVNETFTCSPREAESVGWYSDISFIWILFVYLGNSSPYNFYHLSNKGERSLIQIRWYTSIVPVGIRLVIYGGEKSIMSVYC